MRLFDGWKKEGPGTPAPERGPKLFFYVLGTHFFKLVALNLLLLALALPVVTLPAALSAVNRVCLKLLRDGNCFLWSDFFEEFRKSFVKSLPLGLLFGGGTAAGAYLLALCLANAQNAYSIVFLVLGLFVLSLSLLSGSWAFALLAMVELRVRDLLRDALALAFLELKRALWILGTLLAGGLLAWGLFPASLFLILFVQPALTQLLLCAYVNPAVQSRVIEPYLARAGAGPDAVQQPADAAGPSSPPPA